MEVESRVCADSPSGDLHPEISTIILVNCTPIDCNSALEKEELIESLANGSELLLETCYASKQGVKPYAKRSFVLKKVPVVNREDLLEGSIESHFPWYDAKTAEPESAKRCAELMEISGG